MGVNNVLQELLHPAKEFSPIPFWFFDDAPDKEKIRQQLTDYVEKGVNGFVLHPRIGIPDSLEYLSEAYFDVIRYIVKTACELDMKVVLYDEGMYPSGSAHGQVVAANPEYASKGVRLSEQKPQQGEIITRFADGKYLVYEYTHGTIRGIHFGEDDGEAGAPASADILNPQAVDCFIHLTHDRYYEALSEYFGNTVIAFFTDEPCALGRNAGRYREWLPSLEQEILDAGGSMEELEALFLDKKAENHTTVIYHKLIKKHLRENFYQKLSDWCETHGISLMGHPEVSDDVEEELYFHIPGQDLIMRRVSPESGGLREFDSVQAKLSADIARLLGRRRNANECFGVCNREGIPWYFTGRDMIWYLNWLGVRGVNLFVPHAFYYSVEGRRSGERPPDVGPNNIWWSQYKQISDYIKRISWLMTDSHDNAELAVLCDNNNVPYEEVAPLYEQQIPFHYLPVALMPAPENGSIAIQGYKFSTVLNVIGANTPQGVKAYTDIKTLLSDYKEDATFALADACPTLRREVLTKQGVTMILLCNEGTEQIETVMKLPPRLHYADMDMWSGRYYCTESDGEYALSLAPCEMRLLLLDEVGELPLLPRETVTELGDVTHLLSMVDKADNQATYMWKYHTPTDEAKPVGNETFTVCGEEMAQCWCNGHYAGASLYSPHHFSIGSMLQSGENEIRIVFTGSAANYYNQEEIPYGAGTGSQV